MNCSIKGLAMQMIVIEIMALFQDHLPGVVSCDFVIQSKIHVPLLDLKVVTEDMVESVAH